VLRPSSSRAQAGFTLIEVLIALAIIAMVAAVALPGLARRLDIAFGEADCSSPCPAARLLPARVATLGIDLRLDAAALDKVLPDGNLRWICPAAGSWKVESAARLSHTGSCEPGSLMLREPTRAGRWRLSFPG